jgi:hypothetical protein
MRNLLFQPVCASIWFIALGSYSAYPATIELVVNCGSTPLTASAGQISCLGFITTSKWDLTCLYECPRK